ncbi:MAG: hypothetical protein JWP63_1267, partial [Candidatus Solibacter sp.]|nr:hypothetical protein [Candidatus Solibacter sp.]
WELPVGRGRALMRNSNRILDGILGGWKASAILTATSGRPFTVNAPVSTYTKSTTGSTPDVVGVLPKSTGALQFDGRGACFLCGFTQIVDPSIAKLTPALAAQSTLFAQQGPGGVVLQNPLPGTLGSLAQTFLTGPRLFNVDAALTKQFKVNERFGVEIRTDWLNAANHPDFSGSTIDSNIDSATFGRITGGVGGGRIIVLGARLNW